MAKTVTMQKEHIGDGLYVSFDGFQFCLRAPRPDGDHEVYLEPAVLKAFNNYVARATRKVDVSPELDKAIEEFIDDKPPSIMKE